MGFDSKVLSIVKLWQLQSVVVNISSKHMCTNDLSFCLCKSVDWHRLTLDGSTGALTPGFNVPAYADVAFHQGVVCTPHSASRFALVPWLVKKKWGVFDKD